MHVCNCDPVACCTRHVQVMGPDDGYICQFSQSTSGFWAERNSLALGATFRASSSGSSGSNGSQGPALTGMVSEVRWLLVLRGLMHEWNGLWIAFVQRRI